LDAAATHNKFKRATARVVCVVRDVCARVFKRVCVHEIAFAFVSQSKLLTYNCNQLSRDLFKRVHL
jgi:hypothetical protein